MAKEKDDTQFLSIDMGNLHKEWERQSRLFHQASVDLADVKLDLDTAESRLDVVAAECDKEIRLTPSEFNVEKVTETAVKMAVVMHRKHKAAVEEVNRLKHKAAIYKAKVEALASKKYALQDIVSLRLADYFSEPRVAAEGREELDRAVKAEIRGKAHAKQKRREVVDDD